LSTDEHISTTINMLSELQKTAVKAKTAKQTIEINNVAGQPFSVISKPGGQVAWGVGGGSGGINLNKGVIAEKTAKVSK
jgi:hypothetical protein